MIAIVWPLLVTVLGAFIYGISQNPKISEMGRILFMVGAFWTVHSLAGSSFTIVKQ